MISNQNITVIIPAAGKVKSACNYELSIEDPAFINIGSSLAIDEIKKKTNFKIVLAVKKKECNIFRLCPYNNIEFVEVGETSNITDTIKVCLGVIKTEWCLINPITTIPKLNDLNKSFIEFGSSLLPKENWASIIFDKNSKPLFLSKLDKKSEGLNSYPFTGRIFAKRNDLNIAIDLLENNEKKDLNYLAKKLFEDSKVTINYTNWLDIGHIATYPLTRISSISSRFFNRLIYDKEKNIIKKKSTNKIKIEQEISFYKTIPKEIQRYFPMIINIENKVSDISYEMEYIGKPNLSEIFLFSKIGPNAVLRIFNSVERVYKTFYEKPLILEENASWLYSSKTKSRQRELERIIEKDDFRFLKKIYENDFKINNIQLPSLKKTFFLINEELIKFEKIRPLHLGHGDLCFNNILVDPIYGTINLIDPKAQKHIASNKYGLVDSFYDLSKLNHSIEGLYDSVVNNLYNMKTFDIDNINFEIYQPTEFKYYIRYFEELILNKRISYECLRLLTANLFLNMLPMHIDDVDRVIGLALIGAILASEHSMKEITL